MKSINLSENADEIHSLLDELISSKSILTLWQVDSDQKRVISLARIQQREEQLISCETLKEEGFLFGDGPVFFYHEKSMVIFKCDQVSLNQNIMKFQLPQQMKFVADQVEKIATTNKEQTSTPSSSQDYKLQSLTDSDRKILEAQLGIDLLAQEDELYSAMRETPRAKPEEDKLVTVANKANESQRGSYILYDLSAGGFSFLVMNSDEFSKGTHIDLIAFDTARFEKPMVGQVMNVSEADAMGIQYKVGCRFLTDDEIASL